MGWCFMYLGSFIPDANSQDCDYVKIVKYSDGRIINSKTEYVCDSQNNYHSTIFRG